MSTTYSERKAGAATVPVTPGAEPEPTKGQRRRAQILAIARSVLIEEGYGRFVLRDIAASAGITLGNLQYYFPTAADLVEAVSRDENERALAMIREVRDASIPSADKVVRLVHSICGDWAREGGRIFLLVPLLAAHEARFHQLHMENFKAFYAATSEVLTQLDPELSPPELMRKTRLVVSLIDGAAFQIPLEKGRGSAKQKREFLDELARTALQLMGAETAPATTDPTRS